MLYVIHASVLNTNPDQSFRMKLKIKNPGKVMRKMRELKMKEQRRMKERKRSQNQVMMILRKQRRKRKR